MGLCRSKRRSAAWLRAGRAGSGQGCPVHGPERRSLSWRERRRRRRDRDSSSRSVGAVARVSSLNPAYRCHDQESPSSAVPVRLHHAGPSLAGLAGRAARGCLAALGGECGGGSRAVTAGRRRPRPGRDRRAAGSGTDAFTDGHVTAVVSMHRPVIEVEAAARQLRPLRARGAGARQADRQARALKTVTARWAGRHWFEAGQPTL